MARKTFEITESKAVRVEPVIMSGKPYISIRQLYKKKTDTEWQGGRQGIALDLDRVADILKTVKRYAEMDLEDFTVIEFEKSESGKREDGMGKTKVTKPAAKKAAKPVAKAKTRVPPWEDE